MSAKQYLVTTIDNPFNPHTNFDEWNRFDKDMGYNTIEYLARLADTDTSKSDDENNEAINDAVERICKLNLLGIYRKITPEETPVVRPVD